MALQLEQKKAIVSEVAHSASHALSVVAADYRGLNAAEMTKLRAQARKAGVTLRIVRNTLARRAFANTPFECMSEVFQGPVILAFADKEPGATARLIRDFANEKLEVKGLSLGGQLLDKSQLKLVAELPTREEALAKLMSVMKAPVSKFVGTLSAVPSTLVRTLAAVRDKKQAESA